MFTFNMISFALTPFISEEVPSIYPIEFNVFDKKSFEDFLFHHIVQLIQVEEYMKTLYASTFIFTYLTTVLLFYLKVAVRMTSTVGDLQDCKLKEEVGSMQLINVRPAKNVVVDEESIERRSVIILRNLIELHVLCLRFEF